MSGRLRGTGRADEGCHSGGHFGEHVGKKSSLSSIFATWKMTRVRSKDKDSFKLGREEMLLERSSC